MPKKFENEIKMEIMVLKAQGFGLTKIYKMVQQRIELFEDEDTLQDSIPSYAAIRSWIDEYNNDFSDEDKEQLEYRFEPFTAFDTPNTIPDTAIPMLMDYKKWFYEFPRNLHYWKHFSSVRFSNEFARWVYRVLCTIPDDIPVFDWDDKKNSEESYPYLYFVEKDEVLLWAEKIMFFDMAQRYLGGDIPLDVFSIMSGPSSMEKKSNSKEVNFKFWKSDIYASLNLELLAFEHKTKAEGNWGAHSVANNKLQKEAFIKKSEDAEAIMEDLKQRGFSLEELLGELRNYQKDEEKKIEEENIEERKKIKERKNKLKNGEENE